MFYPVAIGIYTQAVYDDIMLANVAPCSRGSSSQLFSLYLRLHFCQK